MDYRINTKFQEEFNPIDPEKSMIISEADTEALGTEIVVKEESNLQDDSPKAIQLHKPPKPLPPLVPVRYDSELISMPKLIAPMNQHWFGADGWDMPDFVAYTKEDRIKMFERRKVDKPTGYTYMGKRNQVVFDPVTCGLKVEYNDTHGPTMEFVKRAGGRVLRQFSHLDRNDDIYEAKVRQEFNVLEMLNNKNSVMQYTRFNEKFMWLPDHSQNRRQWDRDVNQHGYEFMGRTFINSMYGSYRIKIDGLPQTKIEDEWFLTFDECNKVAERYMGKKAFKQAEFRKDNISNFRGSGNLWTKDHIKIECIRNLKKKSKILENKKMLIFKFFSYRFTIFTGRCQRI